jgi:hypothetical protein
MRVNTSMPLFDVTGKVVVITGASGGCQVPKTVCALADDQAS